MYRAKRQSSGAEIYAPQVDQHSRDQLALAGELHYAIAERQLLLRFQPKIDLAGGDICGVEALVRWQHPESGLLYPDTFIPVAERHGLMRRLTLLIIGLALHQQGEWQRAGIELRSPSTSRRSIYWTCASPPTSAPC